jgi:hypothetical protein
MSVCSRTGRPVEQKANENRLFRRRHGPAVDDINSGKLTS